MLKHDSEVFDKNTKIRNDLHGASLEKIRDGHVLDFIGDTEHEEDWWRFATLTYTQLYLARKLVALLPKQWERYLPIYKNQDNHLFYYF